MNRTSSFARTESMLVALAMLGIFFSAARGSAGTFTTPVRPTASAAAAARLGAEGQEALDFDAGALASLRQAGQTPTVLEGFPIAPGTTGRVVLSRFEVASPDAQITVTGPNGETKLPMPRVIHFKGEVSGDPDSAVYVSAHADKLVAYVHSSAGHAYVGPDESKSGYVVRSADSPLNERQLASHWSCAAEDMPAALTATAEPSYADPNLPEVAGFKQATVRVETDQELLAKFSGDVNAMGAYVMTLYGAINVIYERDLALHLTIVEIHAWTTTDPYTASDTLGLLLKLGDWWHTNKPVGSNPRTMVHYLSGLPVSGGIAWIAVLCAGDFAYGTDWGGAYGLTQVYGTYPLQMWDQDAAAHEQGHNAGSVHTHCYSPPIDHCYNGESGCYSGPVQNPGLGNGTIMSYCHLLGWQYMSLKFHDRCINEQMLPEINAASCLVAQPTFADVPTSNPFFHYIETVYQLGITGGCGGGNYCPSSPVTRAQMAVFLLKTEHGAPYFPPACTGVFPDVPCPSQYAGWIEQLAAEGITSGCGGGNYCPDSPVTRQQMAVFLLKTQHGSAYAPTSCSGLFADVPCPGGTAVDWIEQLYNQGITGGCQTNPLRYCPNDPNTRGQMAVFLVKTFGLTW